MSKQGRHYAEIVPLAAGGSSKSTFTYHGEAAFTAGQLVSVPLGPRSSAGIVVNLVAKPNFKTKPVAKLHELILPSQFLNLGKWIADYYAAPLSKVLQTMLPSGLTAKPRPSESQPQE